jgi:hypothetical protein
VDSVFSVPHGVASAERPVVRTQLRREKVVSVLALSLVAPVRLRRRGAAE